MIDLYYWPTPNGWKVSIFFEEAELPYNLIPVNIGQGDQFKPEFRAISPNQRMPAIVDHDVEGEPISVFESGAILWYLGNRTGRFMPQDERGKKEVLEWLFWQTGNQGPMAGQLSHFVNYAPDDNPYALQRYQGEYDRCAAILEKRLEGRRFIMGDDFTVADMQCWPWIFIAKPLTRSLDPFPNVMRWRNEIKERPAVQRGVDLGKELRRQAPPSEEERQLLFRQNADTVLKQA